MAMPSPEHQPATAPTVQGQRLRMSYEEFLAWADEDVHAEWVDGEVIVQMPPKDRINVLWLSCCSSWASSSSSFNLGATSSRSLRDACTPDGPAREPDLIFIAREHLDRLSQERLSGPADLVVEVISDDSVARDRADKFYEYQEAGVREYWILDSRPGRERTDFYVLDEKGRYRPVPPDADGRYQSTVLPGFWLYVDWVTSVEPPAVLTALAQIVGPQKLVQAIEASAGTSNADRTTGVS